MDHRTWFRMGRGLIQAAGQVGVISWAAARCSKYLMPQLFQREYAGSLISASVRMAGGAAIEHGRDFGVPWGVSESAFSALASNSDYHYQSFGVPGLGLKRGLNKDLVISPYSTFLALEVEPKQAVANLHALEKEGAWERGLLRGDRLYAGTAAVGQTLAGSCAASWPITSA